MGHYVRNNETITHDSWKKPDYMHSTTSLESYTRQGAMHSQWTAWYSSTSPNMEWFYLGVVSARTGVLLLPRMH